MASFLLYNGSIMVTNPPKIALNAVIERPILTMKYLLKLFLFSLILSTPLALKAEDFTVGQAAYLLGRQQVLAQQIARSYMAVELRMEVHSYKSMLIEGINLYNDNLKRLEDYYVNDEVAAAKDEMEEAWDDFYKMIMDAPQGEEVLDLVNLAYDLMKKGDETIKALERYATAEEGDKVDLTALSMLKMATHQNALSQHAILYYLAFWNGVKVSDFFSRYYSVISEYEVNFADIAESTDEFPEFKKQVMENAYAWKDTEQILSNMKGEPDKNDLRKVLTNSNQLFREANQIAKLYQRMVDVGISADNPDE
jgi:tetratricopeptide (TPR) repeat protein